MPEHPHKPDNNVVPMPGAMRDNRTPPQYLVAPVTAGGPNDPRLQEAMRLMEAFLAIEDEQRRAALIALAERLVSFDWVRKTQRR
jgi:hypothetical protein